MKKLLLILNLVLFAAAVGGVVCLIVLVRFNRKPLDIPPAVIAENNTENNRTVAYKDLFRIISDNVIDLDSCFFGADDWFVFYDGERGVDKKLNIKPFTEKTEQLMKNGVLSLSAEHAATSQDWQQSGEYYVESQSDSNSDILFWRNWIAQKNAPSIEIGYRLSVKDRIVTLTRLETQKTIPLRFNVLEGDKARIKVLSFYSICLNNSLFVFLINDRILTCFVDRPPKGRLDILDGKFYEIKFRGSMIYQPVANGQAYSGNKTVAIEMNPLLSL